MIEVEIGEAASYAEAGVNIEAGDAISDVWFQPARATYGVRAGRLGQMAFEAQDFAGIRGLDLDLIQGQYGLVLATAVDGVGTKPEIAERATAERGKRKVVQVVGDEHYGDHSGIPADVIAMVADDMARDGGEPVGINFLYDLRTSDHPDAIEVSRQLAEGARDACIENELVLLNGETAELGDRIGGYPGAFNYNLGGFAIGAAHRKRVLDGSKVKPGDVIVAFRELGFRANGMSLVRKVLKAEFGDDWHLQHPEIAAAVLRPSQVYSKAFVDLHGGYDLSREPRANVNAIVHVTGGGIPGKLQRKLAVTGRGAVLEDLFAPPKIMQQVQNWSMNHVRAKLQTPDADFYQTLNGGIGALTIGPEAETDRVISTAAQHGIEAKVAGYVVKDPGIYVTSQGITHNGEVIAYRPRIR